MNNNSWKAIFDEYKIIEHDFNSEPYIIGAEQIKQATKHFTKTNEREVRILCKQDSREDRPEVFIENNLFLLPVKNGKYAIVKGEGYIDIPEIQSVVKIYKTLKMLMGLHCKYFTNQKNFFKKCSVFARFFSYIIGGLF